MHSTALVGHREHTQKKYTWQASGASSNLPARIYDLNLLTYQDKAGPKVTPLTGPMAT
jgi:hypothetical protein